MYPSLKKERLKIILGVIGVHPFFVDFRQSDVHLQVTPQSNLNCLLSLYCFAQISQWISRDIVLSGLPFDVQVVRSTPKEHEARRVIVNYDSSILHDDVMEVSSYLVYRFNDLISPLITDFLEVSHLYT